jgi:3'-phosphoadenosine 5'-phosphosulfate sulfotransferase (PAPS reductase)/FAD synthetase|tara:strand:- start:591 stop:1361 length:771 start_codon:yes stop_codon:yes gene_type:complete
MKTLKNTYQGKRVISWFSCGAASAAATYLASKKYEGSNFEAVYCRIAEEHTDNFRFLKDFSDRFTIPVQIIGNEKHKFSIYDVFEDRNFIKGPSGAPCTMLLKKEVRKKYQKHNDIQIFGYTSEEQSRADRFIDSNNDVDVDFILLENNWTKKDCLDFVRDSNIEIPVMYKLGYNNNNCVGCVKGGMGYWNKIRVDFPKEFDRMAKLERKINHAINKDKNGPVFLDVLASDRGNFKKDLPSDCGFTCEWKQETLPL